MFKIAALMLAASTLSVYAHEAPTGWSYPSQCCSGIDCRAVPDSAIGTNKLGYLIRKTGELINFRDPRLKESPDGVYHWCSVMGSENTPTICLFVPPLGY